MWFFKNANYNFIGTRRYAFILSGLLILISLISLIIHGGPHYGVDFQGGTFIELRFEDQADPGKTLDIPIEKVRQVFSEFGLGKAEIKHYGSHQEVAVRIEQTENTDELVQKIRKRLEAVFPDTRVLEMRKETVGPKVGKELVWTALYLIFFATLGILFYVMVRYEFRFSVGAVLALVHDILITLGIFSVLNLELNIPIVAALLTIIGYSLNDTIVVFDRIRENLKAHKRDLSKYTQIVNRSINETLSRTIITSGTTLMVVVILYFFGGEVIRDFAFALICGIVIGTYSSIYVASPLIVEWEERKRAKAIVKSR